MTKLFLTAAAFANVLATSAFAAPPRHDAAGRHSMGAYSGGGQYYAYARDPDAVIDGNRIVGRDPDIGIRSQLLKDDHASDY